MIEKENPVANRFFFLEHVTGGEEKRPTERREFKQKILWGWGIDGVLGPVQQPVGGLGLPGQGPVQHALEGAAFVRGVEVGDRVGVVGVPVVGDDADVGVAHDFLPQHIGAVVFFLAGGKPVNLWLRERGGEGGGGFYLGER